MNSLRANLVGLVFILVFSVRLLAQVDDPFLGTPLELQPTTPAVRNLLNEGYKAASVRDFARARAMYVKAVEEARARHQKNDEAIAKLWLGQLDFTLGHWEQAKSSFQSANDQTESDGGELIQAQALSFLAYYPRAAGDLNAAVRLYEAGIAKAKLARNLRLQSSISAELGSTLLGAGRIEDAKEPLERAVEIDDVNAFDSLSLHLVYLAQFQAASKRPLKDVLDVLTRATAVALKDNNFIALIMASTESAKQLMNVGRLAEAKQQIAAVLDGTAAGNDQGRKARLKTAAELPIVDLTVQYTRLELARKQKDVDAEHEVLTALYESTLKNGFKEAHAATCFDIAVGLLNVHKDEESLKYLDEAEHAVESTSLRGRLLDIETERFGALFRLRKYKDASTSAQRWQNLAVESGNRELQFHAAVEQVRAENGAENWQTVVKLSSSAEQILAGISPVSSQVETQISQDRLSLFVLAASAAEHAKNRGVQAVFLSKAVYASINYEHQRTWEWLLPSLRSVVDEMGGLKGVQDLRQQHRAEEALALAECISTLQSAEAVWAGKPIPSDGEVFDEVLAIADELSKTPEGASALEQHINSVGRVAVTFHRVLFSVLLRAYLRKNDYEHAYLVGERLLPTLPTDRISAIDVEDQCLVGLAAIIQKKAAKKVIDRCVDWAEKLDPKRPDLITNAYRLRAQTSGFDDPNVSADALTRVLSEDPSNPELLFRLGNSEARAGRHKDALDAYGRALQLLDKTGKSLEKAQLHRALASVLEQEKKLQEAETHLLVGLELAQAISADELTCNLLVDLAKVASRQGRNKRAEDLLADSYRTSSRVEDAGGRALILWSIALQDESARKYEEAQRIGSEAVALYARIGDITMATAVRNLVGRSLTAAGHADRAIEVLRRALEECNARCDWNQKFWTDYNLSSAHRSKGDYETAIHYGVDARQLSDAEGDANLSAMAAMHTYWSLVLMGDWEQALKDVSAALGTFTKAADRSSQFEALSALVYIYGDRRSEVRNLTKALEVYEQAKVLSSSDPDLDIGAVAEDAVEVYWQLDRFDEAFRFSETRLKYYEKQKDDENFAHALIGNAELYRRLGDLKRAKQSLDRALPLVRKANEVYTTGRYEYVRAGYEASVGNFEEAARLYRSVISTVEQMRLSGAQDRQLKIAESYGFIYDELIGVLQKMQSSDPRRAEEALAVAESNKARQFGKEWGQTFLQELRRKLPSDLLERESELAVQFNGGLDHRPDPAFVAEIWRRAPSYGVIRYPKPIAVSELPLRDGEHFLEFKVGSDSTFVWIGGRAGGQNSILAFYSVPHGRNWLTEKVQSFRKALDSEQPDSIDLGVAEELFAALFPETVRAYVLSAKSLTIIPDDVLYLIPIETLSPKAAKYDFPLAEIPTRYYPSLSSLLIGRATGELRTWSSDLFALADPINPLYERLPSTELEVKSIAGLFNSERVRLYIGEEATRSKLLETDFSEFRFVHFATHGQIVRRGGVSQPALVVSTGGRETSGLVSIPDVLAFKLNADLVVLSACNTGYGHVSKSEGVMNLGRAFLSAGASSAAVSLWPVSDESTADLMTEFYKQVMSGKSKSEALDIARTKVRKTKPNPFFWAAFVLIGD